MTFDNNISKTQVIIVGAGPTGLSMAAQLIRHNIQFVLLEKNPSTTVLSKAIVIQARTLEIFEELGIIDKALALGKTTTAMRIFFKGKQKIALDIKGLGDGMSQFPMSLSLEQSKTEKILAEFIQEQGREINWNSTVDEIQQDNDYVAVNYTQNGTKHTVQGSYLIASDGAGSLIRHKLGIPFSGTTVPKLFYVADVLLKSTTIYMGDPYMFLFKNGFALFIPMEGKEHYRIIGILPDIKDYEKKYEFDEIKERIKNQIATDISFENVRWFSTYNVHSRKADTFRQGRCFLAGDAAHIHTPAGGQGMNTGIQDAYNLAWKIAFALKGVVKDEVLETYNTERIANAKRLLQTTDRMFDIMSGVNPFWNFIRLNIFPLFMGILAKNKFISKRFFPIISQIGISYPNSFLTLQSSLGKAKAGDRMPYFVFSNGKNIFHNLSDPSFKLLCFGNNKNEFLKTKSKLPVTVHKFDEIPNKIFGNNTDFFILLRPDNHICYIGKDMNKYHEVINKISKD